MRASRYADKYCKTTFTIRNFRPSNSRRKIFVMTKNNTKRIIILRWVTALIISFMLALVMVIAGIRGSESTNAEHTGSEPGSTEETGQHNH